MASVRKLCSSEKVQECLHSLKETSQRNTMVGITFAPRCLHMAGCRPPSALHQGKKE